MCFGMIWGCLKMCCIPSNPENMGNMHKHDQHLDFGVPNFQRDRETHMVSSL